MYIDQQSFVIGALAGAGTVILAFFLLFLLKPWRHALFSGTPVPLPFIVGMLLRGNPPTLLIDAYVHLRKIPVMVRVEMVEVVYMANKSRATNSQSLVKLVQEQIAKNEKEEQK